MDGHARGGGQQTHAPQPDGAALLQEEEQAEQHRQCGGGQRPHRGGDVQGTGRQRFLVRVQPVHQLAAQLLGGLTQDGRVKLEGTVLQVLVVRDGIQERGEARCGLRRQLRDLLDELGGRLTERASDDREEDQQADGGRQGGGEAQRAAHPRHERLKQDGDRQRDRDRHDDERQPGGAPQDRGDQSHDDKGAPGERGGHAQGARHEGRGVTLIGVFLAHGQKDGGGLRVPGGVLRGQRRTESSHQVG